MANDDRDLSSRFAPVLTVIVLLVLGSLFPKAELGPRPERRIAARATKSEDKKQTKAKKRSRDAGVQLAVGGGDGTVDLVAYESLGSWIDIYDEWPWDHPTLAVRKLHQRGVRTIFLQTSNYGAKDPIFRPAQTVKFLKSAHRRDMRVVAWYVPSFAHPQIDFRRSKLPIKFSARGHSFDSFGLDIEATVVGNIWRRNRRLLDLSKRLRKMVGPDYSMGAITPDPVKALYWPDFPYERVANLYDVFVPMGYFSFRTDGYLGVKRYANKSIRNIREASGDPNIPIHLIGGIGGETQEPEVKGFVRAVRGNDVLGASYYDFAVTSEKEWKHLETIAKESKKDEAEVSEEPEAVPAVPEPRPTPLTDPDDKKKEENDRDRKKRSKRDDKKRQRKKRDGRKRDGDRRGDGDGRRDRDRNERRRRDRNS